MSVEAQTREEISVQGASLYTRGYVHGTSGNISARLDDGILVTPTNSCLGTIDPGDISKIDWNGKHVAGKRPSKEAFLHLLMYKERPDDKGVVHLHSTHSAAVSCCGGLNTENVLPPLTAYYVMKVGKLPLVPYYAPGDMALAEAVANLAGKHHAVLLANHGPVVSGTSVANAGYAIEELEETAKLFLLLKDHQTSPLTEEQIADLGKRYSR